MDEHVLTGQLGTLVVRTHPIVYPFPAALSLILVLAPGAIARADTLTMKFSDVTETLPT